MKTKTAPEATVRIQRTFHAPLQRVYAAWIDPDLLSQWWGPEDTSTHELHFEPRVTAPWRWVLSDSHGKKMHVHGEFSELVPREKIAFTWVEGSGAGGSGGNGHGHGHGAHGHQHHHHGHGHGHGGDSRVTVDFREARGVVLHIIHAGLHDKHSREQHAAGWNSALDRLQKLVERG